MQQGQWDSAKHCSDEDFEKLVRFAPIDLPPEYLAYLRVSDGGGGDIPVQPWGIYFWQANEVHSNNEGYEVALNVPGFYAFGTSGGGEMFAFDTRRGKPWPVVIIPFIPMDADEALQIASDFTSFQKMFGFCNDESIDEMRLDGWGHPIDPES
jgi:hypothetical protein